ncbi:unnamed protein product, partial [Meganyctiphanes norvegica]
MSSQQCMVEGDSATAPTACFQNCIPMTFPHDVPTHVMTFFRQYGVYGVGIVGAAMVLHSARAFSYFVNASDIPHGFIKSHVRLHGRVKSVSVKPPSVTIPPASRLALPPPTANTQAINGERQLPKDKTNLQEQSEKVHTNNFNSSSQPPYLAPVIDSTTAPEKIFKDGLVPTSEPDSDITRLEYDIDLHPIYIQVEHSPIFRFPWTSRESALPLQLAAIEVNSCGLNQSKTELMGQRIWFTLMSYNNENETLASFIRPAKMWPRRNYNEMLVTKGKAIVGAFDLDLFDDKKYVKLYTRLLTAQEYAEKRKMGMWQASLNKEHGHIKRLWIWVKKVLRRNKD